MRMIIDAYNVLHCSHVLPDVHAGVSASGLGLLISRSRLATQGCVIVCDGRPKPDEYTDDLPPDIEMLHSGPSREADDLIEDLIDASNEPRQLLVISDDHRIRKAARRRRAAIEGAEAFLRRLARSLASSPTSSPHKPADGPGTTAQWMREFGYAPKESEPDREGDDPTGDWLDRHPD